MFYWMIIWHMFNLTRTFDETLFDIQFDLSLLFEKRKHFQIF